MKSIVHTGNKSVTMNRTRYSKEKVPKQALIKMSIETSHTRVEMEVTECRICLQNSMEDPTKKMISPCKCSGSVKYVHEDCMRTWVQSCIKIKTRSEQGTLCEEGAQCEMCKEYIKFEVSQKWACRDWEAVRIFIQRKTALFIVVVTLLLVSIIGIIFSAYSIEAYNLSFENNNLLELALAISGVSIMSAFSLLAIQNLFLQFLLKKEFVVGNVKESRKMEVIIPNQLDFDQQQQVSSLYQLERPASRPHTVQIHDIG